MGTFQVRGMGAKPAAMKTRGGFGVKNTKEAERLENVQEVIDGVEAATNTVERTDFQKRADAEAQRVKDATDSEYVLVPTMMVLDDLGNAQDITLYPALVFQTRDAKEQFLAGMEKRFPGQILGDKYISGELLAKALGFELVARLPNWKKLKPIDKKLQTLT